MSQWTNGQILRSARGFLRRRGEREAQALGHGSRNPEGTFSQTRLSELQGFRDLRADCERERCPSVPNLPRPSDHCKDRGRGRAKPLARVTQKDSVTEPPRGGWMSPTRSPMTDSPVQCPRCQGVMAPDIFEDIDDDTGSRSFRGWRCITCGEVLDPVIAKNRASHREPLQSRSRKKFGTRLSSSPVVRSSDPQG